MALNKRLLRKVRNRIAEIPESYDQSQWIDASSDAPCGTTACIAGETIICAAPDIQTGIATVRELMSKDRNAKFGEFSVYGDVPRRAAELLGIEEADANAMFDSNGTGWPCEYRDRFEHANESGETEAQIAVAYLDECLKRGKVTW